MKRRPLTVYLPDDQRERFRVAASIAGESVTALAEQILAAWLARNKDAIDEAARALDPGKLR